MLIAPIINCGRIFPSENPRIFSMFSLRSRNPVGFHTAANHSLDVGLHTGNQQSERYFFVNLFKRL